MKRDLINNLPNKHICVYTDKDLTETIQRIEKGLKPNEKVFYFVDSFPSLIAMIFNLNTNNFTHYFDIIGEEGFLINEYRPIFKK